MPLFLQLALALAILIAAAKLGGYLSLRLGQPAVLGSLLAGLILGPLLLDFLQWRPFSDIQLGETIHCLAELGVLLLMFIAGLDLHLSDLAKSGKAAVLVGTMGVLLPVVMGYGLGRVRRAVLRYDLPLMPNLQDLLRREESSHRTLFSVVEGQAKVDALVRTTQTIIGDLSQPHTGLLFVVPLLQVFGVHKAETAPVDSQH